LECGRTQQILAILGIDLTSIGDLLIIFYEAKARCPTHKKKAWDMVAIASFWSIWQPRNMKVFDNVEITVQIAARRAWILVSSELIGLRSRKNLLSISGFPSCRNNVFFS
jgi:hypothetical protein